MSNFGWFFLLKKVNIWVKIFVVLILILMFFMFDGMSLIYYIKDLINDTYYNYHYYFKGFLLFLILIPITVNAITLYLLDIIEKKDKISNHKLIQSITFISFFYRYYSAY